MPWPPQWHMASSGKNPSLPWTKQSRLRLGIEFAPDGYVVHLHVPHLPGSNAATVAEKSRTYAEVQGALPAPVILPSVEQRSSTLQAHSPLVSVLRAPRSVHASRRCRARGASA